LLQPTVDELGNFTAHAGAAFEGRNVLGDGNTAVIDHIRAAGLLLAERKYTHRYTMDTGCNTCTSLVTLP
jgi:isoleucyl-tRNA synthetase